MNARRSWLPALGVIALCFAVGLLAGFMARAKDDPGSVLDPVGAESSSGTAHLTALVKSANEASLTASAIAGSKRFGIVQKFAAYLHLIEQAQADEFPGLLETLVRDVPEDFGGDALVAALAKRWVAVDPEAALRALVSGRPQGISGGEDQIITGLIESDQRDLWLALLGEDESITSGHAGRQAELESKFLKGLAQGKPDQFIELIESIAAPGRILDGISSGVGVLAQNQPEKFLDIMRRLPLTAYDRKRWVGIAFNRLAAADSTLAIARLEGLDRDERHQAEQNLARGWAREDPQAAFDWAMDLSGMVRNQALAQVVTLQMRTDPAAAAANALALPSPAGRAKLSGQIARQWFAHDADAAVAWVREELEGRSQSEAYSGMLAAAIDPDTFDEQFDALLEMADGGDGDALTGHLVFSKLWARRDPQAAAEWTLARSRDRGVLFSRVAEIWNGADPAGLNRFVAGVVDPELREIVDWNVKQIREQEGEE